MHKHTIPLIDGAVSFRRVLGSTPRIPPNDFLVRALGKEISAAPVAVASVAAIRMADDRASNVVEVTGNVAAAGREVVDHLAPVVVPRDVGRGIGNGLALKLTSQGDQPFREGFLVGRRLRGARGGNNEWEKKGCNRSRHSLVVAPGAA